MFQDKVPNPHTPTKVVLQKVACRHTYRPQATVRNCLYGLFDSFFSLGSQRSQP